MEIHLQTDAEKGTITIQDTGIGMTQEELVSNLGTIARVEVYSRSVDTDSPGYQWLSEDSGVFEIAEASGVRSGTKIIIHLTADSREFTSEARVGDVVTKYSNFVSFPLYLNRRRINTLQAIWLMDPKDVGESQHEEFYRYIAQAHDKPRYTLHYKTDAPLNIRSIFYAPESKPTMSDVSRELGSSISLYSRQVLIQTKMGAARHFLCMRQLAELPEERDQLLQPTLEIHPRHTLIKKLNQLRDSEPDLAQLLVDQIYENTMITAGLDDDPGPMVSHLNHLIVKALD
ncbi:hypothetical protein E2I00_007170 [Balaenoptera physalus]|uniref:Histidine kinase/HSP90-like ATPase domain-containing protein n=1 Tax=Balaenoptera physalus TaxID=9770 RepID=A0A643C3N4_BALPH|nr:hypothetical protein E2I00_007170 [Balaenoptera physalus]